ncbi:M24 family metallopeptidase [Blastococcus sp. CT_GayMR16]|uniref:M24 family metallopeptidase n=1 Tax=Blastococcus sp. CT_GayMR16 TaxID=2559607 RepID=UPI0010745CE2|nr:M24 family metallopeptidase [Blastococcus sp. CT_GayMR16]TFV89620.1 aminopeptidase P family protein [Blastococcus sp. CT_GayMR16]
MNPGALPPRFDGFSGQEVARRRRALEDVMQAEGLEHVVLYGANRSGSAVSWLTQWPVTREAHVLVTRGEQDVLLVSFYNHVPEARRRATDADVRFAGDDPAAGLVELLRHRGAEGRPLGFVGSLPWDQHATLAEGRRLVDLNRAHTRLRMRKSDEEVRALRHAAALTDAAASALLGTPMVGCTEHELTARIEQAYVSRGGMHHIHYVGVTPMGAPDRSVPAQWPSARQVARGDLLTFELSAAVAPEYSGQLLRSVTVAAEPTAQVQRLHEVAEAALDAVAARLRPGVHARELVEAAGVIEDAGFTTVDDLVHGFGGGYLPPVIGSRSRAIRPTPDVTLQAGMTLVVQPNVATPDGRLGVQTGELLLVTEDGAERLHGFPRGLMRAA